MRPLKSQVACVELQEEGTVVVCSLGARKRELKRTSLRPCCRPRLFQTGRCFQLLPSYLSLTEEKQALDPVTQATLDDITKRGIKVTIIPSKLIRGIKAPKTRLKARIVACGNFLGSLLGESKTQKKHDLYSGGVDLTHLRMLLAFSSRRGFVLLEKVESHNLKVVTLYPSLIMC